ncbi:alpha/beta hydrolase family protein [Saccharopolyspora dendranthemae]|uniref:Platelet-activating factor acetylhydrolase isoform II n=1 Tax=Saccharopolyspora dendranthemae TaxID=1181886 RepID=A0A561U969_9PSEU|nr:alpha/beta hydrolase [Saccharopolyspora dendranthemae]TWF95908.1 platelet-activating factor acetylhydrolase isoform II [Saccharopolyspora dendranthemae]
MRPTRLTALALTTTAAALTTLGATAAPPRPALPEPTGALPIGHTRLHLVDHQRPDPWVPQQPRELMTTLWYPTAHPDRPPAPYLTPAESRATLDYLEGLPELPDDTLSTTRTHAHTNAPPTAPTLPLIVLSPGFKQPRAALTGLAEDLASRGYTVAAIGHNYESVATEFPDGRLTTCLACELNDQTTVQRTRADDVTFLLNELPERTPLRPNRIGMAGHSTGGASTTQVLHNDPRVTAGINLDGTFAPPLTDDLDRPFMLIGAPAHRPGGIDHTWDTSWTHLTGWRRWLTVAATDHASFTDFSSLFEQLGSKLPGEDLDSHRTTKITRDYVAAFFDHHLRGLPQPLLDGPTPHNPEVIFEHHDQR